MLDEQELPPPTEEGEQAIMEDVLLPEGATTDVSAQDIDKYQLLYFFLEKSQFINLQIQLSRVVMEIYSKISVSIVIT